MQATFTTPPACTLEALKDSYLALQVALGVADAKLRLADIFAAVELCWCAHRESAGTRSALRCYGYM